MSTRGLLPEGTWSGRDVASLLPMAALRSLKVRKAITERRVQVVKVVKVRPSASIDSGCGIRILDMALTEQEPLTRRVRHIVLNAITMSAFVLTYVWQD